MQTCTNTYIHNKHTSVDMYIYAYIPYTHAYIHHAYYSLTNIYNIHTHIHNYAYKHMQIIHTYIYAQLHIYTHTYTYIHNYMTQ